MKFGLDTIPLMRVGDAVKRTAGTEAGMLRGETEFKRYDAASRQFGCGGFQLERYNAASRLSSLSGAKLHATFAGVNNKKP